MNDDDEQKPAAKKRWVFRITRSKGPPPVCVGPGRAHDPIYDPMTEEAYRACLAFCGKAKSFLGGNSEMPNVQDLIDVALPHGSFVKAKLDLRKEDQFGPKVLIKFEDADRLNERYKRKSRWFDPAYVPALLMLTYAGGSIRFNDKKPKKDKLGNLTADQDRRFFLTFGRGAGGNVAVLRIIKDALPGLQVHRKMAAKGNRTFHYDYRLDALECKSDDEQRENDHPSGFSRKGRRVAIQIAGDHFERAISRREALADPLLTCALYEELMQKLFSLADELHSAMRRAGTRPTDPDKPG